MVTVRLPDQMEAQLQTLTEIENSTKARRPQRIVYVSCYPKSLVRDLKDLTAAGWRISACIPVDMFPHTTHLEVVVSLDR